MSSLSAFDYLLKLDQTAKAANLELPANENLKDSWSVIGFSMMKQRFIAPMEEVVEMLEEPKATKLPGVQPWVKGVANFRGRLLPLFDLQAFFGEKSASSTKVRRVLVLELGDLYAGIIVNEVYGMLHFPDELEQQPLPEDYSQIKAYSKGLISHDGVDWALFSPHALVRDPRFFNAATS